MKQLRAVYPEKSVYTQQVGPGCCFGALALMLRFYFEVTTWEKKPVPDAQAPSTPRSLINVDCVCMSVSPPLQEWDYAYVHSFYHLSLAVSFVLLLPKRNRYAGTGRNAAKLSCFTLCCCVRCVFSIERFDVWVVCSPPGLVWRRALGLLFCTHQRHVTMFKSS